MGGSSHWAAGRENFIFFHCLLDGAQFRYTLHAYMFLPWLAWNVLNTWPPHRTSSCVSTTPVWRNAWRLLTHSKAPHKDKSDWCFIPAGEAFSPACFVMPFFSRAIFSGLFYFSYWLLFAGLHNKYSFIHYEGCPYHCLSEIIKHFVFQLLYLLR